MTATSPPRDRFWIFMLQMVYLAGLVLVAVLYFTDLIEPRHQIGSVQVAIPWFGAVGAVLISLQGIFDHPYDWNRGLRVWHISRPFIGAIVGTIGVMIFQAGILGVGADPTMPRNADVADSKNILYYLIAFLIGYREATFRELMKRLVDVVLSPATPVSRTAVVLGVAPPAGPLAGGGQVTITGTGFTEARTVRFDGNEVAFERHGDTQLRVTVPPGTAPGPVVVTVGIQDGSTATGSYAYEALPAPPSPPPPQ